MHKWYNENLLVHHSPPESRGDYLFASTKPQSAFHFFTGRSPSPFFPTPGPSGRARNRVFVCANHRTFTLISIDRCSPVLAVRINLIFMNHIYPKTLPGISAATSKLREWGLGNNQRLVFIFRLDFSERSLVLSPSLRWASCGLGQCRGAILFSELSAVEQPRPAARELPPIMDI